MSMFRRPTDDSSESDSSSSEELDHSNAGTDHSNTGVEEVVGAGLTTTTTLSSGESISIDHSRDDVVGDVDHVRDMLLASLLEDFYKTRAAELLNAANPGAAHYNRASPEVRPLAQSLFAQASQTLASNGLLSAMVASDEVRNTRGQYLTGIDTLGVHNLKDHDSIFESIKQTISMPDHQLTLVKAKGPVASSSANTIRNSVRDLALQSERLSIVPHPVNEMHLSSQLPPRSHYQTSFQEMRLLGRGGFGRVYQTYNVFDKKEYAVKKIPLSVKMSQQYREKGHAELASVLREVQALAQLDHCNVVRYHATWIEDPAVPFTAPNPPMFRTPFQPQKLLAGRPTLFHNPDDRRRSFTKLISYGKSDDIMFEVDSNDPDAGKDTDVGWSHNSYLRQRESSIPDSDIFTDGMAQNVRADKNIDDPSCYVLHVQMSMYPTTLAQYLTVAPSNTINSAGISLRRHCFHLVPALQILLGILCGLQYIHARGLIHRDIKPSNIFLSNYEVGSYAHLPDGYHDVGSCLACHSGQPYHVNPRIGDFGLVAELARDGESASGVKSSLGSAVGTEYYRPPVGNGKHPTRTVDEKLDVYALGVIFVELLWQCGTSMERINLLKNVQKGLMPPEITVAIKAEGFPPEIASTVEDCIRGMIDKDHSSRWPCSRVKEQLEQIMNRCNNVTHGLT